MAYSLMTCPYMRIKSVILIKLWCFTVDRNTHHATVSQLQHPWWHCQVLSWQKNSHQLMEGPLGRMLNPSTSRINSAQRPRVFGQRHWLAIHWLQPSVTVHPRRAASSLAPSHPLPYRATSAGGSAVGHQISSGCPLMIHWRQRL